MENKRRSLSLELKIDLILLTIGLCLIIWITITHEEVRKGYNSTGNVGTEYINEANTVGNMEKYSVENRITDKLSRIISQELDIEGQNIEILSVNNFENNFIVTFIYDLLDKSYEGICQVSQDGKLLFKDVDPIDRFEPFTLHEVEFKKDNLPGCTVIYGVVNNPIIKSININFYNRTMINIVLGDENSYSYTNQDYSYPVMGVEGLDESLNIIYKWDKIYKNEV